MNPDQPELTWPQQLRIDETCDRFETQWQSGDPPRLEDWLDGASELVRSRLLRELLALDIEYRLRRGPVPTSEEYSRRIPDAAGLAQQILDEVTAAHRDAPVFTDSTVQAASATRLATEDSVHVAAPHVDETTVAPGRTLGDYDVLEELGRGGMGVVYRARQRSADRTVALKLIRQDRLLDTSAEQRQETIARFRTEARSAAQLEHDHLVTVYDVGEEGGRLFYSMQYIEGQTLSDLVRAGPLAGRQAAEILLPVAQAVSYAHDEAILHRDLKPNNVLIDANGRPFVTDFGMAKRLDPELALTQAGPGMGTPAYMSPEQAEDARSTGPASDVYGLGATLYFMLTSRPPFQAADPLATLRQVVDDEPVPPRRLNPQVPADLETVCLKCLAKDPSRRYATAAELADDVERFLGGRPILARPVGRIERGWRWCRRNPLPASLAILLCLATAVGFAAVTRQWQIAVADEAEAKRQELLAKENADRARQAVDDYFTAVSEETLLRAPGMRPLRRKLLERAVAYYRQFIDQHAGDPALQAALAAAWYRVGRVTLEIGSQQEAQAALQQAVTLFESVLDSSPTDDESLGLLARCYSNLGFISKRTGNLGAAHDLYQQAIEAQWALMLRDDDDPDRRLTLARIKNNLGVLYKD